MPWPTDVWWVSGIPCPVSSSRQPERVLGVVLWTCESARNFTDLGDCWVLFILRDAAVLRVCIPDEKRIVREYIIAGSQRES